MYNHYMTVFRCLKHQDSFQDYTLKRQLTLKIVLFMKSVIFIHILFYQQLIPVKRGGSLSFLVGTISNVLVMEIGWIDVGSRGYILVSKVKIVKNERDHPLFTSKLLIKFQNILRNITQVIIRHRVKILFSVISSPITL
jgi:hypothetical protein